MKKADKTPLDLSELGRTLKYESDVNRDLIFLDDIKQVPYFDYPTKQEYTAAIIILRGKMQLGINLKQHVFKAPCIATSQSGQIIQYFQSSKDFSGLIIAMSKRFQQNLLINTQQGLSLSYYLNNHPAIPLNEKELDLVLDYYSLLRKTMSMTNEPYRMEVAQHLVQAFFWNINDISRYQMTTIRNGKSRQESIVDTFLGYVQEYYKEQRNLDFYAQKLFVSSKHLSSVIKNTSGKSANDWINQHILLEAKALLKSTDMTIQQISDELHFPSQSFFGKYFKRYMGISPKKYRDK